MKEGQGDLSEIWQLKLETAVSTLQSRIKPLLPIQAFNGQVTLPMVHDVDVKIDITHVALNRCTVEYIELQPSIKVNADKKGVFHTDLDLFLDIIARLHIQYPITDDNPFTVMWVDTIVHEETAAKISFVPISDDFIEKLLEAQKDRILKVLQEKMNAAWRPKDWLRLLQKIELKKQNLFIYLNNMQIAVDDFNLIENNLLFLSRASSSVLITDREYAIQDVQWTIHQGAVDTPSVQLQLSWDFVNNYFTSFLPKVKALQEYNVRAIRHHGADHRLFITVDLDFSGVRQVVLSCRVDIIDGLPVITDMRTEDIKGNWFVKNGFQMVRQKIEQKIEHTINEQLIHQLAMAKMSYQNGLRQEIDVFNAHIRAEELKVRSLIVTPSGATVDFISQDLKAHLFSSAKEIA